MFCLKVSVWMFLTAQRYKFESKSQHPGFTTRVACGCFSLHKDTNLKANHNAGTVGSALSNDVSHCTKIQIWKQITTGPAEYYPNDWCFSLHKDTNLKANHNNPGMLMSGNSDVSHCTKIQIWKQITTSSSLTDVLGMMFLTAQRYKFESKSQHD